MSGLSKSARLRVGEPKRLEAHESVVVLAWRRSMAREQFVWKSVRGRGDRSELQVKPLVFCVFLVFLVSKTVVAKQTSRTSV